MLSKKRILKPMVLLITMVILGLSASLLKSSDTVAAGQSEENDKVGVLMYQIKVDHLNSDLTEVLKASDDILHFKEEGEVLMIFAKKEFPRVSFEALLTKGKVKEYNILREGLQYSRTSLFQK